jgi:hypothetical protein
MVEEPETTGIEPPAMCFGWLLPNVVHVDYLRNVPSWKFYLQTHAAACAAAHTRYTELRRPIFMVHTPGTLAMPPGDPIPHLRAAYRLLPAGTTCYMVVENLFARLVIGMVVQSLLEQQIGMGSLKFAKSVRTVLRLAQREAGNGAGSFD